MRLRFWPATASCLIPLASTLPCHAQIQSLTTDGTKNTRSFHTLLHTHPGDKITRNLNNDDASESASNANGNQKTADRKRGPNIYNRNDDETNSSARPDHKTAIRNSFQNRRAAKEGDGYN